MKVSRLQHQTISRVIGLLLFSSPLLTFAETPREMDSWTYHKEWDNTNNVYFSLARSPLPQRGLYDTLRLEIVCQDNKLQFALDSYNLITSKGNTFDFEYQIDNRNPVAITMRTYPDTKRRGYTDEQVKSIVEDLLSGQSVFIRAHTIIRAVLSSAMPLKGAEQPIAQVFADCGENLPGMNGTQRSYSLAEFEQDIKVLSPEQQRQVLSKIREIMDAFR